MFKHLDDNFKQINTKYGHNIGDEALIETVHALNRSCRGTNDKVIRYSMVKVAN